MPTALFQPPNVLCPLAFPGDDNVSRNRNDDLMGSPPPGSENSWASYRRAVILDIQTIKETMKELAKSHDEANERRMAELEKIRLDLAMIKFKLFLMASGSAALVSGGFQLALHFWK